MKILFVTFRFPPYKTIGAVRTGKTAELLASFGHEIYVISAKEQGVPEELKVDINVNNISYTEWFDINRFILKFFGKKSKGIKSSLRSNNGSKKSKILHLCKRLYGGIFHYPDSMVGWIPYAIKEGDKVILDWQPDIILASGMPHSSLVIASKLSKKYHIPWIADMRDLWCDNHYKNSNFIDRLIESSTLKSASHLVTVSNPLKEILMNKYDLPVNTIMNGFDSDDWLDIKKNDNPNDNIEILYAGSVYEGKQDPSILLETISLFDELKQKVIVSFYGNNLDWITKKAKDLNINRNVKVYESIERTQIMRLQKSSDVLLLLTWNNPKEKGILTGKLFEYIAAQTPILCIGAIEDDAANIVQDNGLGFASNKHEEIRNFLLKVKTSEYLEEFSKMSSKNIHKFDRRKQVEKLETIMKGLI